MTEQKMTEAESKEQADFQEDLVRVFNNHFPNNTKVFIRAHLVSVGEQIFRIAKKNSKGM